MLYEFLQKNKHEILALTESKTLQLAGVRVSTDQLKQGLPIFYQQLIKILALTKVSAPMSAVNQKNRQIAADESDEVKMASAEGRPDEAELARSAGLHGTELLRLGYTLSHVVHAYGAMCQAITELATKKNIEITSSEFHDLNRCLDIAIAGAVTEFQNVRNSQEVQREVEHLGSLAHELRNALSAVRISLELIRRGDVGIGGQTSKVLDRNLNRMEELIDRSLAEVRMRVEPQVIKERINVLHFINQIVTVAEVVAKSKNQILSIQVAPDLALESDKQLLYSALSNLIQNAIKFTRLEGKIEVRGKEQGETILLEVEDECGGLLSENGAKLFEPFVQKNENLQGVGLGLTIARRAVSLIQGTIEVQNIPNKGCVFTITIPKNIDKEQATAAKG
jgi:signal transduction histidine kinase